MADIVTRAGKGSPLTFAEVDANFTNLNNAKLETSGGVANNLTVSGALSLSAPLSVINGGTGATTQSAARTALGLAIGTDVQAYDADLAAVAGLSANGLIARTGAGTAAARTLMGTANEITVTNGDGVSGNPTLSFPSALTLSNKTVALSSSLPTLNSDAYYTSNPADGGYFADYVCLTSSFNLLAQAKDQSAESGGGIIDAQFIQNRDEDTVNYTAIGQKISNAVRGVTTGKLSGGTFQIQYKDLVGADFAAIGRIGWNDRGVSGVVTQAIQYGSGIASNEFAVQNPADANEQSTSMCAVQAILKPQKATSSGTHKARGVLTQNVQGYRATSAFEAISTAGAGALTGAFEYALKMDEATVESAAIIMPQSLAGNAGTVIDYGANNYTVFDRANQRYLYVVNGVIPVSISQTRVGVNVTVPDASAALDVTSTTGGVLFTRMTGTQRDAISSPANGLVLYNTTTNKLQVRAAGAWVDLH
jgi:hypothetical protein